MAEVARAGVLQSLQFIDQFGNFDAAGMNAFVKHIKLSQCGLSYVVVAIMGAQSSGKSTLLNFLFGTSFDEMDAMLGRTQTTQGMWIAHAPDIQPCTIVMDLEGSDGRERGEDDTAFEKQSALFALAVADVVLINIWCHDIGREHAANKPLLRIVFQVMMRLFKPRKTTLLFVIRDKTKTPFHSLESTLKNEVRQIWKSVPKPQSFEGTEISDFLNVQVTSLSSYEHDPDEFKNQVANLRERFHNSIAPDGLAGDRTSVVAGNGFSASTESIWKTIKENRDLDLPSHKVLVATIRCQEIANEKLMKFLETEEWIKLKDSAQSGEVSGFGPSVNSLLKMCISKYDEESAYYDEKVRTHKRDFLVSEALLKVNPVHKAILSQHRTKALNGFKQRLKDWAVNREAMNCFATTARFGEDAAMSDFDRGVADAQVIYAQWDASQLRDKLRREIRAHVLEVRTEKIGRIVSMAEKQLAENIGKFSGPLFDCATPDTWEVVRRFLASELHDTRSSLLSDLSGYEVEPEEEKSLVQNLADVGRRVVQKEARDRADRARLLMKDWFITRFYDDTSLLPTCDIGALAKRAQTSCLKQLSVLAAVRLDDTTTDGIERALATLLDADGQALYLAAISWDGIETNCTLLTPARCKEIWREFQIETVDYHIKLALANQKSAKATRGSRAQDMLSNFAGGLVGTLLLGAVTGMGPAFAAKRPT